MLLLVHINTAFVCGLYPSSLAKHCDELSEVFECEHEAEGFEKGFFKMLILCFLVIMK